MTVSPAQRKSADKYIAKNYTRIGLAMPNDEAEAMREHCRKHGVTINGFIRDAIAEKIERDKAEK